METKVYSPKHVVRVVTATSLFDGHDAAINIMRRILQDSGVEVIHIGHNRSAKEIVDAAIQEDVQGVAVSSYQGGHLEFFKYIIDLLNEQRASKIRVFGGGGGVIIPSEIKELHDYGVSRIYSPEDGSEMGLQGMINHMIQTMDKDMDEAGNYPAELKPDRLKTGSSYDIAKYITSVQHKIDNDQAGLEKLITGIQKANSNKNIPVIGLTGTGGAGKSSLTDELVNRILRDMPGKKIGILSCDPSRRKTGGALLGDRIRMNTLSSDRVYMRSLATRDSRTELPEALEPAIEILKASGYDFVIAETAGIGQGDSRIVDLVDISVYVMTPEYGAPSQLEKIDMLDYADIVVVNKYEKKGSQDALRDVRKQVQRNRKAWEVDPEDMPVYGTIASNFNDDGVTAFYHGLLHDINEKYKLNFISSLPRSLKKESSRKSVIIPGNRIHYLSDISQTIKQYHEKTKDQAEKLREHWHFEYVLDCLKETGCAVDNLKNVFESSASGIDSETIDSLDEFKKLKRLYKTDEFVYKARDKEVKSSLFTKSLAGLRIPKISLPDFEDPGEQYLWIRKENVPGRFPYTAGVFPLKRSDEDPTRMFAGEGGPEDTNKRFKLLSENYPAKRLSTAFDSVTLYGVDPDVRPDIYGKVGTSGVSIATLDDVKTLYRDFDLCASNTSVSMTINGPAPIILAMFLNAAIDQQADSFKKENKCGPSRKEAALIKAFALEHVRGTVQADILKEDQGQNTCIFSMDFALKMMGDIQEYFIANRVKNFYSVSISGYHIAEAGANPITQLALTLANGFTYVEYYLSRGMDINDFAPSLSFFFSNGMDPEYTVIGRVARRIWSIAMKNYYKADEKSQKLKYHIQTSGRSLHSRDIQFNDIRTTLQGLCAVYDNCNSLHTNAFDEAITTPSAESVRRALAIQLIVNKEWGLTMNENSLQGSFIVDELTDLVEEAVLAEFERISSRGGVLGAMETGYQRGKIQAESIYYESLKDAGNLPLIGVNTFINPELDYEVTADRLELSRATDEQKRDQLGRLKKFKNRHAKESDQAIDILKSTVLSGDNIFEQLMETVKVCSLGTITEALYEVGGKYRRNM